MNHLLKNPKLLIPNAVTALNLLLSYLSITEVINGNYLLAAFMIVTGNFVDVLDGRLAKGLNATSKFGMAFDSLTDLAIFGLAPSVFLYKVYFAEWGILGSLLSFLPALFCAIRLAAFNTQVSGGDKFYFAGLPTPCASSLTIGFAIFIYDLQKAFVMPEIMAFLVILSAYLMVSGISYESDAVIAPKRILRTWKGWTYIVCVVTVLLFPMKSYFFWAVVFILFGLGRAVLSGLRVARWNPRTN